MQKLYSIIFVYNLLNNFIIIFIYYILKSILMWIILHYFKKHINGIKENTLKVQTI
jgi:hypothetical protein